MDGILILTDNDIYIFCVYEQQQQEEAFETVNFACLYLILITSVVSSAERFNLMAL